MSAEHPLDNPARAALLGPQSWLAERYGQILRYPAEVCPFTGIPARPDEAAWADLAAAVGPGGIAVTAAQAVDPPAGWQLVRTIDAVQMVAEGVRARPDAEALMLTSADVPEMLELVARTEPGPFLPRTIELGNYLGIRRNDELIAMAGERLHPPGWTEISAVCTDVRFRGQGLGTRLVHAVAALISDRGEIPFLHAAASNTGAIRLYEALGFRISRRAPFMILRAPKAAR
jgi:ribosomal protein S18 acetylase RimI-like enzyme